MEATIMGSIQYRVYWDNGLGFRVQGLGFRV